MKLTFRATLIALAASALITLAACNPGTTGLFSYIGQETKDVPGSLTKATVTSMAEDSANYYVAGGGKLFSRTIAAGTWEKVTITNQNWYRAVRSVGNTSVYALAATAIDTDPVVFYGASWAPVTLSGGEVPEDLVPVVGSDGHSVVAVVVVTKTTVQTTKTAFNTVYVLGDSGAATRVDLGAAFGADVGTKVLSAAYDGTNMYLLNDTALFTASFNPASVAVGSLTQVTGPPAGLDYAAILSVSGSTATLDGFYLATKKLNSAGSSIYRSTSGTSWGSPTTLVTNAKASSVAIEVTSMVFPAASAPCVYVGTESAGYGELTATAISPWAATPVATTITGGYDATALPTSYVTLLYVAANGTNPVFLGADTLGLWAHSADNKWSQE